MRLRSLLIALLAVTTETLAVPSIVREKRCATNIECVREREAIAAANPVPLLTDPIRRRIRAIRGSATPTESTASSTSSGSVSETSLSTSSVSATSASSTTSVSSSSAESSELSSTSSTSVSSSSSSTSSTSTSPSPSPSVGPSERFFSEVGITSVTLAAGRYDVAAWGAQGGGAEGTGGVFIPGGPGINYNRTVILDATYQIMVAVGGIGGDETRARISGGGGGGGSFVYTASGIPLIIGGGGGGSSFNGQGVRSSGGIFATAGRGRGGAGGENGMGGGVAEVSNEVGGGAGFYGSGVPASNPGSGRSQPDFAGGVSTNGGRGGFGGGGAGGDFAGGGGGGYNGGGAGGAGSGAPGGAGGSYAFSSFSPNGYQLVGDTNYFGPGKVYIYGPY